MSKIVLKLCILQEQVEKNSINENKKIWLKIWGGWDSRRGCIGDADADGEGGHENVAYQLVEGAHRRVMSEACSTML